VENPQHKVPAPDDGRGVIAWFANNPVAANLLMIFIIAVGLLSLNNIRRELNPDLSIDVITISTLYPGASPEEVEIGITVPIEEAVKDIVGIESVNARAREGHSMVHIHLLEGFDTATLLNKVKNRVDGINNLPQQAEKSIIEQFDFKIPAIQLQLHGDIDEKHLNILLRQMRREMLALPDISSLEIFGLRDYEVSIEVSELTLQKYQLSLRDVADAINRSSLNLAGGVIQANSGDILLRTAGQAYREKDFARIVLQTTTDGTRLLLGDVADIRDGFHERSGLSLFDRHYGAGIMVYAVGEQDVIKTTEIIKAYAEQKRGTLPDNVQLSEWQDLSHYINGRINLMAKNLALGAALVFIILLLLLNFRLAFWVMAGLPVCFLGAAALIQIEGIDVTLNMVSLFGFITVLGIMVDDAIIIGESIDSHTRRRGLSTPEVIRGVRRVAIPATFGVLTTVAAFVPTVTLSSVLAPMPAAIGWVVIFCLLLSLVESKLILPAHIAHSRITQLPLLTSASRFSDRISQRCNAALQRFVERRYQPFLLRAMQQRYTTLASFFAALILAGGLLASGIVLLVIVPVSPSDFISVRAEMIEGTPEEKTYRAVEQLSEGLYQIDAESAKEGSTSGFIKHSYAWGVAGEYVEMVVELSKHEQRSLDSYDIIARWRELSGDIAGTRSVTFKSEDESFGDPISLNLISDNPQQLEAASIELRRALARYQGVFDIDSTLSDRLDEIDIHSKPSGEMLGLGLSDIGTQVRDAFYGVEAQRIQRGDSEVKVMVRYPRAERKTLADLENMYIRSHSGDTLPFYAVAEISAQPTHTRINRIDGKHAVNVSAKVDKQHYNPDAISAEIVSNDLPPLLKKYPSLSYEIDGEGKESRELVEALLQRFLLAIIAVYALLAIPLKSYSQPLVIMSVIPFSLIGAIVGHLLFDTAFSMMSLFGVIALTGVVVNDSLILADTINHKLSQKLPLITSIVGACKQRFRAILITSLTTFFGLFPMLLEDSLQAQSMLPMAISLAFGIVFATVISLILVPCLFVILHDFQARRAGSKTSPALPKRATN